MSKFCKICGAELVEGKCPNGEHLKKMCLNCTFCDETSDETLICNNKENLEAALNKVKESLPSGYEIETLTLKPIPLKDPCKKCKKWTLNQEVVLKNLIG